MIEYGSDYHYIPISTPCKSKYKIGNNKLIFTSTGRQCLVALIRQAQWKRIWVPDYFCYEVLATLKKQTDISISFYPDNPLNIDDTTIINKIQFLPGDVLLRINYFGIRSFRDEREINVPVIEDHTHNLCSEWASKSNADWCIASLRKSLPLAEGGAMWSPKEWILKDSLKKEFDNVEISERRWRAMHLKAEYLRGERTDKNTFRKILLETEEWFGSAQPSSIDDKTLNYFDNFNISEWQKKRHNNWSILYSLFSNKLEILKPENNRNVMFAFVVLFKNREVRDWVRQKMIDKSIYPAILWKCPESASIDSILFSERMLSIHCDGRYSEEDINQMAQILNTVI